MTGKNSRLSDREVEELLRELGRQRLMREDEEWRSRVPEYADRAAERAFGTMRRWIAAGAIPAAAGTAAALSAVKIAAAAVTAAGVICAGAAVAPVVREWASPQITAEQPFDHDIPSPGEDFTLIREERTERLSAAWFTSDRQQVMVQIAKKLPETPEGETITVSGLPGELREENRTVTVTADYGSVKLRVTYYNAERDEALRYMEEIIKNMQFDKEGDQYDPNE